ncbi:MAG: HEPN domain-containing protein [Solirubrobacterales bacterium]
MAEPRSSDDLAQLLMEKAAGDEKILLRLIDDDDIPDDGLGFHAQQAVEKMIKAVLAHNDVSYERTHNIAYLLTLLDDASIPRPDNAANLPNLSPWAAELRYARQPEARARPSGDAFFGRADPGLGESSADRPLRLTIRPR